MKNSFIFCVLFILSIDLLTAQTKIRNPDNKLVWFQSIPPGSITKADTILHNKIDSLIKLNSKKENTWYLDYIEGKIDTLFDCTQLEFKFCEPCGYTGLLRLSKLDGMSIDWYGDFNVDGPVFKSQDGRPLEPIIFDATQIEQIYAVGVGCKQEPSNNNNNNNSCDCSLRTLNYEVVYIDKIATLSATQFTLYLSGFIGGDPINTWSVKAYKNGGGFDNYSGTGILNTFTHDFLSSGIHLIEYTVNFVSGRTMTNTIYADIQGSNYKPIALYALPNPSIGSVCGNNIYTYFGDEANTLNGLPATASINYFGTHTTNITLNQQFENTGINIEGGLNTITLSATIGGYLFSYSNQIESDCP